MAEIWDTELDDLELRVVVAEITWPKELGPAEVKVAELVLMGLSNAAVAERRGVSPRTVANQLARIYDKLGVSSRFELGRLLCGPRHQRPVGHDE